MLLDVDRAALRRICAEVQRRIADGEAAYAVDLTLRGGEPVPIRRAHLGQTQAILCVPENGGVFWSTELFDADRRRIDGSGSKAIGHSELGSAFDEPTSDGFSQIRIAFESPRSETQLSKSH